ncbi:D-alanyl-D-alanine carboxypeptidase/D-alanyl-D-alanine-endopeptidase [Arachidicoccus ginsenosidimutans]|nr:D-alanyl-D-alanine carboxypeptidase/D-alanyl-D-alanine-endopeptidase [Arachidicoccus sp. BS20]
MRKIFVSLLLITFSVPVFAQEVKTRLATATQHLLNDVQMKNASISFYVADASTGKLVYQYNGEKGLSPASTQKIFTTVATFEILGDNYTFKTDIGYNGNVSNGILKGDLIVRGFGDPTLGSWRYAGFKPEDVKEKFLSIIANAGIQQIDGNIIIDESSWGFNPTPGGWPWDDLGNYYGAGDWGINWNENQINLTLRPGKSVGDDVAVTKIDPQLQGAKLVNRLTTGSAGSGDNSTIYVAPYSPVVYADGSVPAGKSLMITGSMPNPPLQFGYELKKWLGEKNISLTGEIKTASDFILMDKNAPKMTTKLAVYNSPSARDIIYHFLRKSVNLYGESFAKAIGWQEKNNASTAAGVSVIRKFWLENGINYASLHMIDGSGLSPQDYVTAHAEVTALLYAQKKDWFSEFYKSLPTYNGTKMKSGTISACKAYAGYQTSKSGKKYVFSMIINDYYGSQYNLLPKMYKILDVLK